MNSHLLTVTLKTGKRFLLTVAIVTGLAWSAHAQSALHLVNSATGRQKVIGTNNRIKVRFYTQARDVSLTRSGRVAAITDSTLLLKAPFRREQTTIYLNNITAIQKYTAAGYYSLAIATGVLGGAGLAAIQSGRNALLPSVLVLAGTVLVFNGLEALVYPLRSVNREGSRWQLKR
jgi:hypothetical protein